MTPKNIAVDPDILQRYEQLAADTGRTVDDLANDAMKCELARRFFELNRREAEARRGDMTDEEVEAEVDRTVHDYRSEQRRR
jgi:predicted transcriptional regulator